MFGLLVLPAPLGHFISGRSMSLCLRNSLNILATLESSKGYFFSCVHSKSTYDLDMLEKSSFMLCFFPTFVVKFKGDTSICMDSLLSLLGTKLVHLLGSCLSFFLLGSWTSTTPFLTEDKAQIHVMGMSSYLFKGVYLIPYKI